MPIREWKWPFDRCRGCGMPLDDGGLYALLLAWSSGRLCVRCRESASTRRGPVVVAAPDEQQNPFSFFIPEDTLNRPDPGHASDAGAAPVSPEPQTRRRRFVPAPAQSLVLAFGLGVAIGAGPGWLQDAGGAAATPQPQTSSEARSGGVPSDGVAAASARTRTVFATDRFLPPSPTTSTPQTSSRSSDGDRSVSSRGSTAARRPRVRAVRYPGRKPAAFRGSVAVNTTPAGARVSLDGTALGSTPLRIDNVPAGSHVLRLEADGRRVSASAIQVVANRTTRVTRALERTP